ncbi:MAG: leucyl/phenylalanyl-tRNA--protein transferase [Deltaproteobacteria bacterium]|nr:leucyl/phenylalanyl-tRNA--protein transferase [Deltaproteobacteria bacterium]
MPKTIHPLDFPDDFSTTREGLLAVGGNLHPITIINAYAKGIFPWFNDDDPILWWHPHPRMIIPPSAVHISKKMKKLLNKTALRPCFEPGRDELYQITLNQDFMRVINECANKRDKNRTDTWITDEMASTYITLHEMGFAHSVEVWNQNGELVGGVYGVAIGKAFFGESMFSHETNTSKLALIHLCQFIDQQGFTLLDCQIENPHLVTLGGKNIARSKFLKLLNQAETNLKQPSLAFPSHQTLRQVSSAGA